MLAGALRSIPLNLIIMLHDTFQKKCVDLLAPPQGPRVYIRTEYVLACALCSISFNLICNMTTFRKKMF